jgi:hypothetical protein
MVGPGARGDERLRSAKRAGDLDCSLDRRVPQKLHLLRTEAVLGQAQPDGGDHAAGVISDRRGDSADFVAIAAVIDSESVHPDFGEHVGELAGVGDRPIRVLRQRLLEDPRDLGIFTVGEQDAPGGDARRGASASYV